METTRFPGTWIALAAVATLLAAGAIATPALAQGRAQSPLVPRVYECPHFWDDSTMSDWYAPSHPYHSWRDSTPAISPRTSSWQPQVGPQHPESSWMDTPASRGQSSATGIQSDQRHGHMGRGGHVGRSGR